MSQFKIAMKKGKKLVINVAVNKEVVASSASLEALGSFREEKERVESLERRRDVFGGSDDDGVMREVDVGTGLSGVLNRLREQGDFKIVGVKEDHEVERFRDGFKDIQIVRRDEWGRELNAEDAFRALSHAFHGKKPGKRKQGKRNKKQEGKSREMEYSDRAVERMRQVQANLKTPYIVL